jgi:DNA adenine methylase
MGIAPRRPALRYYGSKWRLAPFVIAQFPPHTCYVEPFGGGAAVLLQKPPSYVEVYNDADRLVVTFFRVLRERPEALIRAIERTPFSRAELELAYRPSEDELEQARRFYVRAWQSRSGPSGQWRGGWRFERSDARHKTITANWNDTCHLWAIARRLKQVCIECDEALAVIGRYDAPATLFYLDPPYPRRTRARWGRTGYRHEMTDEDHHRLAGVLHGIQGLALVSSYPSDLYDELYGARGWRKVAREVRTEVKKTATEVLWISPRASQAALPLFAHADATNRSATTGGERVV